MAHIRQLDINSWDNISPLEENVRAIENSPHIRESEILILRSQVVSIEGSLNDLTLEYKEFLETNNLIDVGIDAESLIPYPQISPLYDPEEFDSSNYIKRDTILVDNPMFVPLSNAINEGDDLLGPFGRKIEWYQNEIRKKYIVKKIILKRIEDIESRENND
jgi:hypothetical protein